MRPSASSPTWPKASERSPGSLSERLGLTKQTKVKNGFLWVFKGFSFKFFNGFLGALSVCLFDFGGFWCF